MWSKPTGHMCGETPPPHAQVRRLTSDCALPLAVFIITCSFFSYAEPVILGNSDQKSKTQLQLGYAYLKPHLITQRKAFVVSQPLSPLCWEGWLLITGVVLGWSLSGSTTNGAEVLLLEITCRRSKRCPEAGDGAAPWAAGSWLSCILPVVSCSTLWLTEYP